ncbi:transposase family protein [Streptomyces sp. NBC_00576]|uniref:transposase family protein n=1 Tax=Streptomyces sp. NBC_00576 TaxID=2903665 RepID=UPI002E7FFCF3|nr:transposase family protein [Streptomyces sp. NBC_00576]WUB73524.1 transposase family protein [Streptomyces sp. NBC_00576]
MPARTSSPIPAPLEPLARAVVVLSPREVVDLRRFLDRVPDPRGRCGRRYPAVTLLTATAVLAGARSLAAVGEWIAGAPQQVRAALGLPPDPLTATHGTRHPTPLLNLIG